MERKAKHQHPCPVSYRLEHLHSLAAHVEEGLDVQIIGGQDDLEQHLLVHIDEFLIPVTDICSSFAVLFALVGGRRGIRSVVTTVLENLEVENDTSSQQLSLSNCHRT